MVAVTLQLIKCPYCEARHKGVKVEIPANERNYITGPVIYECNSCGYKIDMLRMALMRLSEGKAASWRIS